VPAHPGGPGQNLRGPQNGCVCVCVKGRLYSSCVQSSMLHGIETWPIIKENEVALQRAEMRMFRWMCGVKLQDRVPGKGLREGLGLDDIISVLQQNRSQLYRHVLRKEDNDWMNCTEYEVDGARPRGRQKKTWREIVEKDCQACKLMSRACPVRFSITSHFTHI